MREAKYTPGPWHVESGAVWAEAKDGAILKLAYVGTVPHYVSMAERDENASLIAAAPELLEACGYMHQLLVDLGHGGLAGAILGKNAIAKAEGRK